MQAEPLIWLDEEGSGGYSNLMTDELNLNQILTIDRKPPARRLNRLMGLQML